MTSRRITTTLIAVGWLWLAAPDGFAQTEQEGKAPVAGWQLMTEQERDQYRTAMHALQTEEERTAMRAKHQKEMRARAKEQGVELSDIHAPGGQRGRGPDAAKGGRGRGRGRDLMTPEEQELRRQEMRSKTSAEERERARTEHHERMKERARERGSELPDESMRSGRSGHGNGPGPGSGRGRAGARSH